MTAAADCAFYRGLISADLDGEASAAEARDLALHLACCAGCSRARADYMRIGGALEPATRAERPRPEVWDAIERHVTAGQRARAAAGGRPARAGRVALRAAGFLIALGGAFALGRLTAPSPAPAPAAPVAAKAPASASSEAEEAAVAIVADVLFAGGTDPADMNARIRSLGPRAPAAGGDRGGEGRY